MDKPCTERFICQLHAMIMRGSTQGRPRQQSGYRQSNVRIGNFVYVPPAYEEVPALMAGLAAWATGPGLELPRQLFAGILAYQFVTIHPFEDGNGRTCRALATWALRSGDADSVVDPVGLLNVEEFYAHDLEGYYDALQMGCHVDYALSNEQGSRSDPDLTPWLDYFCSVLQRSATQVCDTIIASFRAAHPDSLSDPLADRPRAFRRLLARLPEPGASISSADVAAWLHVSDRTARDWLKSWMTEGHVEPAKPDAQRIHAYRLTSANIAILDAQPELGS